MVTHLNNPDADGGGIWLPNIQRPFVWSESQIERVFDSIMREYPIGTLLIWRTKNNIRRRKFIDHYRREIKLSTYNVNVEDSKRKMLVLDGQQRLQSLFIGLLGSYEKKELYFDILSGEPVSPDDIRYKFKFLDNTNVPPRFIKFKKIVFNDKQYNQIAEDIIKSITNPLSDNEKQMIMNNVALIVKVFKGDANIPYQEVDSIDNEQKYTEEDVVEIFIRANSGGTPLGKSDLMFSLLSTIWEESNEQTEELLEEINKTGFAFSKDFVLKTCLTLLEKGAAYNVEKFRAKGTREKIIDEWDEITSSIKFVKDFVYGTTYIHSDKALPSYLALIPLIYFRYHYKEKWSKAKNLDEYLIRSLMTGAFGGTPDNLIDKCVKEINKDQDFITQNIFRVIQESGKSLDLSADTILENRYGSKNIHLFLNYWYKSFDYHPSFENNLPQVDHIFPQSKLRSIKDLNPRSGRYDLLRYKKEDRDQIANLMLLTQEENGAGGKTDILPADWFSNKPESYLDLHAIPKDPELWKLENFERFVEERKNLVLKKFDNLLAKQSFF